MASKTSIIISNLAKQDFVRDHQSSSIARDLSLVDKIKLEILNIDIDHDEDYFLTRILNWSNLPFLNRAIVILKDEASSKILYDWLEKNKAKLGLPEDVKITLQENLLQRSKSHDSLVDGNLSVEELQKFKRKNGSNDDKDSLSDYEEPKPQRFNALADLQKLGIDTSQADEPTRIERSGSVTRTLFKPKPDLSINTDLDKHSSLSSPIITLDEST